MGENVVNNLADTSPDKPFTVYDAALNRNGLVNILLAFERDDEIINFNSEVHIDNVP
jgi:MSHA biogenesis protein MshO